MREYRHYFIAINFRISGLTNLARLKATIKLLSRLEEAEQSARENGWLTADEVGAALGYSMPKLIYAPKARDDLQGECCNLFQKHLTNSSVIL